MNRDLVAEALPAEDPDAVELLCPSVGRFFAPAERGALLGPGSVAGRLRVLGGSRRILVPDGVAGHVVEVLAAPFSAVEYRQPLYRLSTKAGPLPEISGASPGEIQSEAEDLPAGAIAVRSPTDGIFYRRPSPEEPPFAAEGERIENGRVLGLVEVMKCFNQVTWTGDSAAPMKLTRVAARDGGEVKQGEVLFVLAPADGDGDGKKEEADS